MSSLFICIHCFLLSFSNLLYLSKPVAVTTMYYAVALFISGVLCIVLFLSIFIILHYVVYVISIFLMNEFLDYDAHYSTACVAFSVFEGQQTKFSLLGSSTFYLIHELFTRLIENTQKQIYHDALSFSVSQNLRCSSNKNQQHRQTKMVLHGTWPLNRDPACYS